ncbi:hypothetical protein H2199_004197 [Coniosporium tulheliwenetii]|uniref:Uncharacterized protein n=1 Tax=Coniosporium tulheliwenetii TaxID=3383036 RepID=A0ACC2Z7J0_9PEZI|nr:hypothetical protein H2199_004197 [Cladosporium sp. JES 115]
MSGAGEAKWRRGSQTTANTTSTQNSLRGRQSAQTSGTSTPNPELGKRQSLSSASGNTWDRSRSGSTAGQGQGQQRGGVSGGQGGGAKGAGAGAGATDGGLSAMPAAAMVQEEHVPVNGYNADEVRAFLASGRGSAAVDGVKGGKVPVWKAGGENKGVRSGGRGARSMASGQDFWVQLRKQIAGLEQGKAG